MKPAEVRAAYAGASGAWAAGPAAIYRRMAEPLVRFSPVPLAGARVLDLGAGTGATTDALLDAGARVVAADLTFDMLAVERERRPPAVVADALALPIRPDAFDAAAGAFVISHVPTPSAALAELARVVHPGGAVTTVGFDGRWQFPAKEIIDGALVRAGAAIPDWYEEFKARVEPLTAYPDRLADVARAAGLADVTVHEVTVDVGMRDPRGLVDWRVGTPVFAPFAAGLADHAREALVDTICAELGPDPDPLVPALLVLSARVR